ncbi:DUF3311 domain-containing protein [Scopulibacillus cellulosilyticus]|uniref:DUF3311 domain-containing protein n=1 Tax=Scopulibacillus cellulosilyticus TaxID=2665665 RepID=A0ABW2PX69_9BACL
MSFRQVASVIIGIVIPFIAVVGMLPFIGRLDVHVFGIPFLYFWMFMWFPLTSVCLWICWFAFDKPRFKESAKGSDE